MTRTIVLSPHYDDAVLGAYSALVRGPSAEVVTVFGGAARDGFQLGPVAREFLADCRLPADSREANRLRREEDEQALSQAGVPSYQLDFPEALYRDHDDGGPLIGCDADLFETGLDGNRGIVEAIDRSLTNQLTGARRLVIPLANGNHIDHRIVRQVSEAIAVRLGLARIWYAEPTYGEVSGDLAPAGTEQRSCRLDEDTWTGKRRAVEAYRSQLRMFGVFPESAPDPEAAGRFWDALRSEVFYVEAGSP